MDLMSRITKGAAGAALGGSSGASMGGAVVGCITSVGGTVFGPAVLSSVQPSVPVLVLLLAVLSALLPVSAVAFFPSSHGFFYFKYTSLFFNAASYISSARLIGSITITLLP